MSSSKNVRPKGLKFTKRLLAVHSLHIAVVSIVGLIVLGGAWLYAKPVYKKEPASVTGPIVTKPPSTDQSTGDTKAPQVAKITSTPSSLPTVKTVPVATPKPSPAPVIKTSPSSSVDNLKPVSSSSSSPSSPPSSSGSGTNSSGSNTSGSDTSGSASLPDASGGYQATNWAGYLATGDSYTGVSGSWIADTPSANGSTTAYDASWIGIGGVTSADLIQVGTTNSVTAGGQVTTQAFYEMLPSSAIYISSLSVKAGDSISASLTETSANLWKITINDLTSGGSFTTSLGYISTNSSVEWIEEDPSSTFNHLLPLDSFSQVDFSNCLNTVSGVPENLSQAATEPVTMVNSSNQPIASPSVLASDKTDFNVYEDSN